MRAVAGCRRGGCESACDRKRAGEAYRSDSALARHRRLPDQILPVAGIFQRFGKPQQLFGVDKTLAEGDFLGASDLQPLALLHDVDELRRLQQRFMGAGVEPGVAAAETLGM